MDFFLKYKPYYSVATGSHTSAMLLLRLMFWQDVMKGKEFAKPSVELQNELFLSRDIISREIVRLQELGFITCRIKKFNNAPTYHFQVFNKLVENALSKYENAIFVNSENRKTRKSENTEIKNSKTRKSIDLSKTRKSITEEDKEKTTEENNLAKTSFADFQQPPYSDLFEATKAEPAKPKPPKEPKEKPAPKHKHFTEFKDSYLNWYKSKFGIAHTFAAKEAGLLSTLIDRLKQIAQSDEQIALQTFQVILTNWDELGNYNRNKPQLNLILTNLNSICTELKEVNEYELKDQQWILESQAKRGNYYASWSDYQAGIKSER
jgi:hypothetical protein